jgi:hypothetical protein
VRTGDAPEYMRLRNTLDLLATTHGATPLILTVGLFLKFSETTSLLILVLTS